MLYPFKCALRLKYLNLLVFFLRCPDSLFHFLFFFSSFLFLAVLIYVFKYIPPKLPIKLPDRKPYNNNKKKKSGINIENK